jgi:hypothetical protein
MNEAGFSKGELQIFLINLLDAEYAAVVRSVGPCTIWTPRGASDNTYKYPIIAGSTCDHAFVEFGVM